MGRRDLTPVLLRTQGFQGCVLGHPRIGSGAWTVPHVRIQGQTVWRGIKIGHGRAGGEKWVEEEEEEEVLLTAYNK